MFALKNYTDGSGVRQQSISALYIDDFKDRGTLAYVRGVDDDWEVLIQLYDDHVTFYRASIEYALEASQDIYGQDTVRLVFVPFKYEHGDETEAESVDLTFKLIDGVWKKREEKEE